MRQYSEGEVLGTSQDRLPKAPSGMRWISYGGDGHSFKLVREEVSAGQQDASSGRLESLVRFLRKQHKYEKIHSQMTEPQD